VSDDTLPAGRASTPAMAPVELGKRYELRGVIGRGGMGEVRLAHDTQIEREVAVKLMHPEQRDDATVARFFREARVQGQLEHPAVVPVHDLGIDRGGNPYFVMKRLAGTTLAQVLAESGTSSRVDGGPRRQLLARLVDVCLAIEFAHTRGVVHRDLKPANIMLGDFGEAYVLDWGLARIVGDSAELPPASMPRRADEVLGGSSGSSETVPGQILGTPGYMSPEQFRGEVDAKSDVFALGCILFEILAGEPAMRGMDVMKTLNAECHRPSDLAPRVEIPVELDDLCARATAQERSSRPTARELAAGIQAYLDGDRDLERRRALAAEHAARAELAFGEDGDEARAIAMREAGRAFTLDPTNATAQAMLGRLLLEAPSEIPAGALAAADLERGRTRQRVLRWAAKVFIGTTVMPLGLLLLQVRHAWPILAMSAVNAAIAAACWGASRRVLPMRSGWFYVVLSLDVALLVTTGLIFGPVFVLPMFLIGSLAAWMVQPAAGEIPIIVIAHLLAILPLVVLEVLGVTPATFRMVDGGLLLTPWAIELTSFSASLILAAAYASQFFNTLFIALAGWRAQEASRNRVHAQSWHLQQLVPRRAERPPTD
jgi:serine/threonine-protein kinase